MSVLGRFVAFGDWKLNENCRLRLWEIGNKVNGGKWRLAKSYKFFIYKCLPVPVRGRFVAILGGLEIK